MKRGENVSTSIDSLNIQITADATKASNAIDGLVRRLDLLTKELGKVNGNKLVNFSNSLNTISVAMNNFSGIKLPDFNRVVKGINKLATIDTTNLSRVGNELAPLANSISAFSNVNFDNRNLQGFINSLSRLASANVGSLASADFNALGQSLNQLATSLSNAPKIQQSVIQMTSAIANLAKSGANIPTVVNSLPSLSTALKNFMTVMSTAPTISADTITFSQAIAQLANSGQRAGVTAGNLEALGNGLRNLMTTLSRAPVVNSSVVQLTTALANLASQGNRVGSASNMLVSGLNRTHTAARRTSKGMTSLAAAFGKFYATYFLVIRGFKALWRSIEGTADYIEAYNYFDVAMGKIGKDWSHQFEKYGYENAEAYAESFKERLSTSLESLSGVKIEIGADGSGLLVESGMKNLGLNIQEVTQYASQLASVTNSVGQTGEVSLAAASAFTKLGADMSSLFNLDYSQVMNNLQSGLIGQSRALYRYGIDITNATLQTKAYELGIEKAVSEMTQAEKMQLRMLAILEQSKVSWGDLANTINSPSNMIRQFTNNLKEAGMILGQLFIPLLQKVLPILNGVMIALKRLMVTIANFFGIKLDLEGFGQGFSGLEDDIGGVGDSLDDATNSAKKFKKQLAGFDELENLSSETGKSKLGVGGAGIDLTDEILKATAEYEKAFADAMERMENDAQNWADKIVEFFTTGNVAAKISKALTKALNSINWNSIYKSAKGFGKGLAKFLNDLITPDLFAAIGKTIGNYWNTLVLSALTFGQEFDWGNLGESLSSGVNNFFATFDAKSLAETINVWIKGALKTASTFLKKTDFEMIGNKIGEFLRELDFGDILGDIANLIWDAIKGGFDLVKGIFEEAPLEASLITAFAICKFTGLGDKVGGLIGNAVFESLKNPKTWANLGGAIVAGVVGWNLGQILWEAVSGDEIEMTWTEQFGEIFKSFTDGTWTDALTLWGEDVYDAFVQIGEDQQEWAKDTYDKVAGIISDWWTNKVSPWFTKEKWAELWETVKDTASEMWDNFVDWWSNTAIGQWWENDVAPWFTKEKWLGTMTGVAEAFETTWNTAIDSIKEIWNKFANWMNDKLTWEIEPIEIMGKTIFEGTTINLGKIPTFAIGGFPKEDGLFMANRGELVGQFSNGKTAVANNEQITTGIANAVYPAVYNAVSEAMRSNAGSNEPKIKVFVGDRELTDIVIDGVNDRFRRTGNFAFDI